MKKRGLFFYIFNGFPKNLSFRGRLFISFMAIAIPVLATMALISYLLTATNNINTMVQAQETQLAHLNARLSSVYSDTESVSRDIILSATIQNYMNEALQSNSYPDDANVSYTLAALMADRDYIDSIVLTSTSYTLFSTGKAYTDRASFDKIKTKWWYHDMTASPRSSNWFPYSTLSSKSWNSQRNGEIPPQNNTHMLARGIYSVDSPDVQLGYVMIYLNDDYMQRLWHEIDWGSTTNMYLLDSDDHVLSSNLPMRDYSDILSEYGSSTQNLALWHNGGSFIYSCSELGINDWKTCMISRYKELNHSLPNFATILFILILALIVLIFLMSRRSAVYMSRPITVLSNVMDSYHGPQQPKNSALMERYSRRTDEIGDIYRSYEQLQNRVQNLIQEIYVKNLEKKDAELALLQSQINPHFLNWLALMHDEEEISNMVTALSDTFRLSLMKNNTYFVELDMEIEYVKSYLVLQHYRFGDKLSYEIHVPEFEKKLFIPRFILQPLVENGIKHGLSKLPGGGHIEIDVKRESENLIIYVKNDGVSLDIDKMDRILVYNPADSELLSFKSEGYGVQNIFRRIKVICGEEYGLAYSIERGQTVCKITLPVKNTDE